MHNVKNHISKKWVALALVLVLSACGNVPQPFRDGPKVTTDNPLLDVPTAVGIAVLPVRGAPVPLNTQISAAAATRLQTFEIPAEPVPVNRGLGFTLEGEARPAETTATDISLVITWTLRSRRGANVRTYRQVVTVPTASWREDNQELATKLGNDAALAMGDLINGIAIPAQGPLGAPGANVATAEAKPAPPMPAFPTVSVKPVEGAPGDGRESLRLAVLQSLNDNGVRRDDINPQVILNCQMTSTPYDSSNQKVEIVWRAVGRDGKELGTVKLDNTIPIGALDGPWGPTAFAVAGAALNDLLTLLASNAPTTSGSESRAVAPPPAPTAVTPPPKSTAKPAAKPAAPAAKPKSTKKKPS